MSKLSILITCLNDQEECNATIASIRQTAGDKPEIIVIDDGSRPPLELEDKGVRLIRHGHRSGVGPARHIAAMHATGDYLLIMDSHCRFEPGWYEAAMERIVGRMATMHCGQCVGLSEKNMDMSKSTSFYNGATINFLGPDPNKPGEIQVLEGVWLPDRPGEDDYEIPAVMGACYFIPKDFFFYLGGLKLLREWGSDEPFLSLKVWLAGGEIRMMKSVRMGHKFRESAPYSSERASMIYNKLAIMATCIPSEYSDKMFQGFHQTPDVRIAMNRMNQDAGYLYIEALEYERIFRRDLKWYLDYFKIPFAL